MVMGGHGGPEMIEVPIATGAMLGRGKLASLQGSWTVPISVSSFGRDTMRTTSKPHSPGLQAT